MQGLPVILKWHNLQSLDNALDLFIEFKFCESNFYFLNGSKNCMVATYNFVSVYSVKSKSVDISQVRSECLLCTEWEACG